MGPTFTQQLREGYRQLLAALPCDERAEVECLRASFRGARQEERAARLAELVIAYRLGPRCRWGPVLLEVLAPRLVAVVRKLRQEPPFIAEDDLRDELLVEVLAAAARMPLPVSNAYLEWRLLARAKRYVVRRLSRERRRQRRQASLDFIQERDEAMAEWERWKSMMPRPAN